MKSRGVTQATNSGVLSPQLGHLGIPALINHRPLAERSMLSMLGARPILVVLQGILFLFVSSLELLELAQTAEIAGQLSVSKLNGQVDLT